jgi:hypothetical protein
MSVPSRVGSRREVVDAGGDPMTVAVVAVRDLLLVFVNNNAFARLALRTFYD